MLRQQLLDTARGRIVSLLQRGPLTVDDIASKLKLSASGVRAQITAMERDGVVRRQGSRAGTTRPSRLFELTPEVEQLLSQAYIPLLTQLVDVFAEEVPARQVDKLLRQVGVNLARQLSPARPCGLVTVACHCREPIAQRSTRRGDACRGERRLHDPWRGMSIVRADRETSVGLPGPGKPGQGVGRRLGSRMLRAHRASAVLF